MKSTWELLESKYPSKEYSLLREVRNAAGYSASRSADGMVIGHWPSRGCEVEGLELKANRGDWINELKNPQKAEEIFKFCDRWWIVAERENIVKIEEVPPPWGFMECSNEKLKVIKQAPKLEPIPLTHGIVVSMLKRSIAKMDNMVSRDSISIEINKAVEEGKVRASWQYKDTERSYNYLKESVKKFEEKSGVNINSWNGERIGNAVKTVLLMDTIDVKGQLVELQNTANRISESIRKILEENNDVPKE